VSDIADVLVIGAGAAGAAASWRLASQGMRVTCLEQGSWAPPEAGPADGADWERRRLGDWSPNPNTRRGAADYPVGHADSPFRPLMFNGVGGSTVMWSALLPRMHPSDFVMRRQDGVGDDWPIGYHDLAPYYDLNERMNGVAGPVGNPAYPPMTADRLPAARLLPGEGPILDAFERLGWHWWPAELALNTAPHGAGRGTCVACGPCELGCPHRAKASADVVYWPAALALGARLVTGARVAEIPLDAAGHATGAVWIDRHGRRHLTRARSVVIAANGVGTPRLLMLAATGKFPNGLANSSGLVGRRLMLHPLARVTGLFDAAVDGWRGNAAGAITSHEFYETDRQRGFLRGVKLQIMRGVGPAVTALGAGGARMPWGKAHAGAFGATFGHGLGVSICSDDLPDPKNRVELDSACDSDGLPGARLAYTIGANTRAALDFGMARARELLREAGASTLLELPLLRDAGFHLMGTARMGDDPETSVTDATGRTHDVPNLYIADGSLFVTAGAVNPTHTIQALALRQADIMVATARTQRDPH
jgi:choline dehydrogenase-like flavoprotein